MESTSKVRKQLVLDQKEIDLVKKILSAKTDTEAVSAALDLVIANRKINETLNSIKGKGKIVDVYGRTGSCGYY